MIYRLAQTFNRIEAGSVTPMLDDPVGLFVQVLDNGTGAVLETITAGQATANRLWRVSVGVWQFQLRDELLEPLKSYTVNWNYQMNRGNANVARTNFVWQPVPESSHDDDSCVITGSLKNTQGLPAAGASLVVETYTDIVTQSARTMQRMVTTDAFGNWWTELPKAAIARFVLGDLSKVVRVPRDKVVAKLVDLPNLPLQNIARLDPFGYPYPDQESGPAFRPVDVVQPVSDVTTVIYENAAAEGQSVLSGINQSPLIVLAGYPVARTATGVVRASASSIDSRADGVAVLAAEPYAQVSYVTSGRVVVDDWTPIIGTQYLTPGATYFLTADGRLVTPAPMAPAVSLIQLIGEAVNATTLDLKIGSYEVQL